MKARYFSTLMLMLSVAACSALAQGVPSSISYQGKLADSGGQPVADGTYQVQFKLYAVETEGTAFWTSALQSVQTKGGLFTTEIKPITPGDLAGKTDVWLETWVALPPAALAPLSPRVKLASVPFALRAADAIRARRATCTILLGATSDVLAPGRPPEDGRDDLVVRRALVGVGRSTGRVP